MGCSVTVVAPPQLAGGAQPHLHGDSRRSIGNRDWTPTLGCGGCVCVRVIRLIFLDYLHAVAAWRAHLSERKKSWDNTKAVGRGLWRRLPRASNRPDSTAAAPIRSLIMLTETENQYGTSTR